MGAICYSDPIGPVTTYICTACSKKRTFTKFH